MVLCIWTYQKEFIPAKNKCTVIAGVIGYLFVTNDFLKLVFLISLVYVFLIIQMWHDIFWYDDNHIIAVWFITDYNEIEIILLVLGYNIMNYSRRVFIKIQKNQFKSINVDVFLDFSITLSIWIPQKLVPSAFNKILKVLTWTTLWSSAKRMSDSKFIPLVRA